MWTTRIVSERPRRTATVRSTVPNVLSDCLWTSTERATGQRMWARSCNPPPPCSDYVIVAVLYCFSPWVPRGDSGVQIGNWAVLSRLPFP